MLKALPAFARLHTLRCSGATPARATR
jgi:hypothetical protein